MAYTTQAKVAKLLPWMTFSASTAVTVTDVTDLIALVDAWLDSKLASRYVVPITGTEALKVMELISSHKVAAMILDRVEQGPQRAEKAKDWDEWVKEMVRKLEDQEMVLTDATFDNRREKSVIQTAKNDSAGNERDPQFTLADEF